MVFFTLMATLENTASSEVTKKDVIAFVRTPEGLAIQKALERAIYKAIPEILAGKMKAVDLSAPHPVDDRTHAIQCKLGELLVEKMFARRQMPVVPFILKRAALEVAVVLSDSDPTLSEDAPTQTWNKGKK